MLALKRIKVHSYEKGLHFRDQEFKRLLEPGVHWFFDPFGKVAVHVANLRQPWLEHPQLDLVVAADVLGEQATVLDLKDHERALVWIDGRFAQVVGPGVTALWTTHRKVRAEIVDARTLRFDHPEAATIRKTPSGSLSLEEVVVPEDHVGVYFRNGTYTETLSAGTYRFWKNVERYEVKPVSLAEQTMDVAGQEIMTADKVTLRLNALVTYRVAHPEKSVRVAADARQALYRETQLALRAVIGGQDLDALLADKDAMASALGDLVKPRAEALGLTVVSLGIRDVILPGDMKELLNRVTEARKAAETNVIARREETAAMRSQVNTARLFENNPTLMRLRELELLEKIAGNSKLSVMLGEKGLGERIMNLV